MITKILEHLNVSLTPEPELLPKAKKVLDIAGVEVPMYGELLVGELELKNAVTRAATPYLTGIQKMYMLLGNPNTSLTDLIPQLQAGKVVVHETELAEIDYDSIGQSQLQELADRLCVTRFISLDVYQDGNLVTDLLDIIVEHFDKWINNGIFGVDGLSIANRVLLKDPVHRVTGTQIKHVDSAEILKESGLSWDDLFMFQELDSDLFYPLLVIYFRTGIGSFNPFSYLTSGQAEESIKQMHDEINASDRSNQTEQIVENKSTQVDKGNSEAEEEPPLSEKSTVTSLPAKLRKGRS